jgi:hypothetical protein
MLYGVGAVVVAWVLAGALAREQPRRIAGQAGALVALIVAGGGVWLARNWIETGNPLFPAPVHLGGLEIFRGHSDYITERLSEYVDEPSIWRRYLWPQAKVILALPALVLVLGAAAGVVGAIGARGVRDRGRTAVLAAFGAAVAIVVAYVLTPYSAQGLHHRPVQFLANTRYVIPAVILAAGAAAWMGGRWLRSPVRQALATLVALVAVLDGLRRVFSEPALHEARTALALGAVGGAGYAAWRMRARAGRGALAAAGALLVVALAFAGQRLERRVDAGRYAGLDPTVDWVLAHAPSGHRVGLAGFWTGERFAPPLAMQGPRFGNRIAYVGPRVGGLLRIYRGAGPFTTALRRQRYDLLLVQRGVLRPGPVLREERWARAVGYRPVAAGALLTLYRAPAGP